MSAQGAVVDVHGPEILGLTRVTALFSAVALVFDLLASCSVHHRYFAGIANFVDVSFHAGLKAAFAGLDIRAKLFGVSRTGLGIYHLEQYRLAVVGQVLDVRLEAVLDLPSASLHSWALRLGILQASAGYFHRRRHGRWEQQHGGKKQRASDGNTCGHVNLLSGYVHGVTKCLEGLGRLSSSERKPLHSIAHTCGHGG